VRLEQAFKTNRTSIMIPQPIHIQEQPRPKPTLSCNQSINQPNMKWINNPEKHPGLEFILYSYN